MILARIISKTVFYFKIELRFQNQNSILKLWFDSKTEVQFKIKLPLQNQAFILKSKLVALRFVITVL